MTKWTAAQLDANEARGEALLVSAAAGSGKTSVLAERCAGLVCDAGEGGRGRMGIGELLVVTFTDAAAGQMKARIRGALEGRLRGCEEDGGDEGLAEHLRRQVALVDQAGVSTIHSFCLRLIRRNFQRLGVDPGFALMEGDESTLLRMQVVKNLFMEKYELGEEAFAGLVEQYGRGRDGGLMKMVVGTHELLGSLVDREGWMREAQGRIEEAGEVAMKESVLGKEYLQALSDELHGLHEECREGLRSGELGDFPKYVSYMEDLMEELGGWVEAFEGGGLNGLAKRVLEFKARPLPAYPKDKPGKDAASALMKRVQEPMKERLGGKLMFTEKDWGAGMRRMAPYSRVFLELVREFGERYSAAKGRLRAMDYSDLERGALTLLREDGMEGLAPSGVARECHLNFRHVLVDEYQDVNQVQDAILHLVSHESVAGRGRASNLFCVGDVKQSIYRFRLAEPARFLRRAEDLRGGMKRGRVIDLQANFRSRAPLLGAINALFGKLMTKEAVEIEYDETQKLVAGAEFGEGAGAFRGAPVELHLLPVKFDGGGGPDGEEEGVEAEWESDRAQREATIAADCILRLMGKKDTAGAVVFEKDGGYRPLEWRDVVILLRSVKVQAEHYAETLRAHGVPVHAGAGAGFFNAVEIRDVLALLNLLNNARQDLYVAAVLRSPIAGLKHADDALARIRMAYPRKDVEEEGKESVLGVGFAEAAFLYAKEKGDELAGELRGFFEKFGAWRKLAHRVGVAELIWMIYQESGYLGYCGGLENGRQRVANLLDLHGRAKQFGTFARQGLGRFLGFLKSLEEEADLAEAAVDSEADNVVRITSVHKAKGLEFPVVILPDMGKKFNSQSWSGGILADREMGLGMEAVDLELGISYPTLGQVVVQKRLREQNLAEEMRILYVAMTRAREHLILIGSVSEKKAEGWQKRWDGWRGKLPKETILGAGTVLDWIGPAVTAIDSTGGGDGGRCFAVDQVSAEAIRDLVEKPMRARVDREKLGPFVRMEKLSGVEENEGARELVERMGSRYGFEAFTELEARQAVTVVSKGAAFVGVGKEDEGEGEKREGGEAEKGAVGGGTVLATPAFLLSERVFSGVDRGTALHLVMEHLDFGGDVTRAGLAGQIAGMVKGKFMTEAQAEMVDLDGVVWFLGTEVGKMIRGNLGGVKREIPFNLAVGAENFIGAEAAKGAGGLDQVMIRGQIDLLVAGEEGCVVVDYKTDRVEGAALEERVELYRGQMNFYKKAVGEITGREVRACYLVFLSGRRVVGV